VALFLTSTVFGHSCHIVLNSDLKTFNGMIGLTASDPSKNKAAHEQEVLDIECNFEAGMFFQNSGACLPFFFFFIHIF